MADQRINKEAIDQLQSYFVEVFMRPMDRVSSLEGDDGVPSLFMKVTAGLSWR